MRLGFLPALAVGMASMGNTVLAEVNISAAISLKGVLEESKPLLEKAAGETVVINYGASGTLAGQVRQGAPVDLFISADRLNVEKLKEGKLLKDESIVVLARNELVLAVPKKEREGVSVKSFEDLTQATVSKVAIGEPKTVPAGTYAVEVLKGYGIYEGLEKAGKLVMGDNVSRVLLYVSKGEVDAGVVYRTDAIATEKVTIVATAPAKFHKPIEYVSAVVKGSAKAEKAEALQRAIVGAEVQEIFAKAGFVGPDGPATKPAETQPKNP